MSKEDGGFYQSNSNMHVNDATGVSRRGDCNYWNPGGQREGEAAPGRKTRVRYWCDDEQTYHPYTPKSRTFHTTDAFTDKALEWLSEKETTNKPFFLYLAYTAQHDPPHVSHAELVLHWRVCFGCFGKTVPDPLQSIGRRHTFPRWRCPGMKPLDALQFFNQLLFGKPWSPFTFVRPFSARMCWVGGGRISCGCEVKAPLLAGSGQDGV